MDNISKQLNLLEKEDIVWIIYLFIVVFALYTNKLEKEYLFDKNKVKQKLASKINTTILIVAFFIYLYLASVSLNNCKRNYKNNIDKRVSIERLVVSLTFLIGGALAIIADYDNNTNNLDIAIF